MRTEAFLIDVQFGTSPASIVWLLNLVAHHVGTATLQPNYHWPLKRSRMIGMSSVITSIFFFPISPFLGRRLK